MAIKYLGIGRPKINVMSPAHDVKGSGEDVAPQPARISMPALNGLRFFAALGVAVFHFVGYFNVQLGPVGFALVYGTSNRQSLFFMLSGFILALAYGRKLVQSSSTPMRFLLHRVARLYPLYLMVLALRVPWLLQKFQDEPWFAKILIIVPKFFLVQTWYPKAIYWYDTTWTLSVEAFFCVIFPFVAIKIFQAEKRTLFIGFATVMALSIVPPLVADYILTPHYPIESSWILHFLVKSPYLRSFEFLTGIYLFRIYSLYEFEIKAFISKHLVALTTAILVSYSLLTISPLHLALYAGVPSLIFCPLILLLTQSKGLLSWFLGLKVFDQLGKASYCMFVLNMPIIGIMARLPIQTGKMGENLGTIAYGSLVMLVLVGASILCHLHIEMPVKDWLVAKFDRFAPASRPATK